jgi:hypothetical protein
MDLKSFLSKTARAFLSDVDNAHLSDVYVRTGLINVFYDMISFSHESACEFNGF